ncbi:amino acid ABC transporter substrate-binding protein [Paraburkholderia pallida]|uniref:Amino acid ABC transporter substrate-binding protein n=1 Tax=Paraburkholderia pallida TaxID=2547399 RepID=A0A4P7D3B5_9BURK|nr:amino acid ABC transporter substrate-binding protein [Paraburkholderia pallida]
MALLSAVVVGLVSVGTSQIAHATVINVGSTPSSAPTGFLDTKTGDYIGLMPDIAQEIAKRSHFDLKYQAIPNGALTQSLIAGKIDLIAAGLSPTPVREKVIDFSQPVTTIPDGIIVKDSNTRTYKSASDFVNQKIGVLAGTDYVDMLKAQNNYNAQEVKLYDTTGDIVRDVELGRIDVGIDDYPKLKYQEAKGGFKGMHVVDSYSPMAKNDIIAFAVQKGNATLLKEINAALDSMKADGTLDALLKKWHWRGN